MTGVQTCALPISADGDVPVVETGIAEAEMIKYANNTFLATKEIGRASCRERVYTKV